jgi:hypothetical protein
MLNDLMSFGVTTENIPATSAGRYGGYSSWGIVIHRSAVSGDALILSGCTAPWVIDAAKKLEALGKLSKGWDSYGGLPLNLNARKLTVSSLGWLEDKNLPVPAVVLGSAGTVQLEWTMKGRELEIELGKDDGIEFLKVQPTGETEEGEEKINVPQRLRGLTSWLLNG